MPGVLVQGQNVLPGCQVLARRHEEVVVQCVTRCAGALGPGTMAALLRRNGTGGKR